MPIYVTKSFLPPLEEYVALLNDIWSRTVLTNQGPLVLKFQTKLIDYLKSVWQNGQKRVDVTKYLENKYLI